MPHGLSRTFSPLGAGWLLVLCLVSSGCVSPPKPAVDAPRENAWVRLPPYVVDPPDILLLDAIRLVPRPPYHIVPQDSILVQAVNVPAEEPVAGLYTVAPDGTINLGFSYGSVQVAGKTLDEARDLIEKQLREAKVKNPQARVSLGQIGGVQLIRGEHLVRPDGTVGLGIYGSVAVSGLTMDQAREEIEQRLSEFFLEPKVSLDVYAYNSKYYYVIADGAGYGQQLLRFPVTGKETVLDAVSQIYGLPLVSSKYQIWVARSSEADGCKTEILPVDWTCLTEGGSSATNYQLLPGDRVFIQSQGLVRFNNALAKVFAPIERVLGITLLGSSTVQGIQQIGILSRSTNTNGLITPGGNIVSTPSK